MDQVAVAYEQLMARFVEWAQTEDNIRAVLVIGSRARTDHPADEWSDLDLIILANDPESYWATTGWLAHVGNPWLTFVEPTSDGQGFERRVLFEGGLDVDLVPIPAAGFWKMLDQGLPPDVADVFRRGMRFLLDRDGLSGRLTSVLADLSPSIPLSESEFLNLVNDFWFHTVWTAKKLRRGELWTAKSCCDDYLKRLLRQLLEWHARAFRGEGVDTWMQGRFLEEWADARAIASLPAAFAHYDKEDVWRALMASMKLFHWVAVEIADASGYMYPLSGEEQATGLVQRLFSTRK